jgi:hypothetical protein
MLHSPCHQENQQTEKQAMTTTTTSTLKTKLIVKVIGLLNENQVADAVSDYFSAMMPNTADDIAPISWVEVFEAEEITNGVFEVEVEFDFEDGATLADILPQPVTIDGCLDCSTLEIKSENQ